MEGRHELVDAAAYAQELAEVMRKSIADRASRASKERRVAHDGARTAANRARIGRAAQVWRSRRATLSLSGVRLAGEVEGGAVEVARDIEGMVAALLAHWMPVFQHSAADAPDMALEAERWTARWPFERMILRQCAM